MSQQSNSHRIRALEDQIKALTTLQVGKVKRRRIVGGLMIVGLLAAYAVYGLIAYTVLSNEHAEPQTQASSDEKSTQFDIGRFGDSFGFLTGLVTGIGLIVAIVALWKQTEEIDLVKQEVEHTRAAIGLQSRDLDDREKSLDRQMRQIEEQTRHIANSAEAQKVAAERQAASTAALERQAQAMEEVRLASDLADWRRGIVNMMRTTADLAHDSLRSYQNYQKTQQIRDDTTHHQWHDRAVGFTATVERQAAAVLADVTNRTDRIDAPTWIALHQLCSVVLTEASLLDEWAPKFKAIESIRGIAELHIEAGSDGGAVPNGE